MINGSHEAEVKREKGGKSLLKIYIPIEPIAHDYSPI
jgi:hypothetical protein